MNKGIFAAILIIVFGLGFGGGFYTSYYKYVKKPQMAVQEQAKKQQEELNKMVRHGKIVSVAPDRMEMKVEKGGGDIGKTIKAETTQFTSIQVGTGFVNKPNEKTDLTKWFKEGDTVDMLYKDGQALALHRDPRADEAQQQTQPPAQQQTQK
ncbi:hypothetical protein ACETAC_01410 [Aceticella autotrophica]|uniref:Uncharacterized protein n=1 Tax=Aceticella autotrophica TaxID=2755338 RepID=A0A975AW70_9THEO|nr:hypothetical protein [Aceticella autotrophica]QSZ27601.1 hypothetical protein ACETAC_01410 [Aceticella autotrophica]